MKNNIEKINIELDQEYKTWILEIKEIINTQIIPTLQSYGVNSALLNNNKNSKKKNCSDCDGDTSNLPLEFIKNTENIYKITELFPLKYSKINHQFNNEKVIQNDLRKIYYNRINDNNFPLSYLYFVTKYLKLTLNDSFNYSESINLYPIFDLDALSKDTISSIDNIFTNFFYENSFDEILLHKRIFLKHKNHIAPFIITGTLSDTIQNRITLAKDLKNKKQKCYSFKFHLDFFQHFIYDGEINEYTELLNIGKIPGIDDEIINFIDTEIRNLTKDYYYNEDSPYKNKDSPYEIVIKSNTNRISIEAFQNCLKRFYFLILFYNIAVNINSYHFAKKIVPKDDKKILGYKSTIISIINSPDFKNFIEYTDTKEYQKNILIKSDFNNFKEIDPEISKKEADLNAKLKESLDNNINQSYYKQTYR